MLAEFRLLPPTHLSAPSPPVRGQSPATGRRPPNQAAHTPPPTYLSVRVIYRPVGLSLVSDNQHFIHKHFPVVTVSRAEVCLAKTPRQEVMRYDESPPRNNGARGRAERKTIIIIFSLFSPHITHLTGTLNTSSCFMSTSSCIQHCIAMFIVCIFLKLRGLVFVIQLSPSV